MTKDTIYREDAIKAIREVVAPLIPTLYGTGIKAPLDCEMALRALPSADRPQGEWKSVKASIYPYGYDVECSICGHRMGSSFGYKYCPMCGCRMKGSDDE